MDWLKRNWVDVVMGGLILAIAAGVFVVLVRGGLFTSTDSNSTTPNTISVPNPPTSVTTLPPAIPATTTTTPTPAARKISAPASTSNQKAPQNPIPPRATANLAVPEIPEAPNAQITKPQNTVSSSTKNTAVSSSPTRSSGAGSSARPTAPMAPKPKPVQATVPTRTSPINTPNTDGGYSRADFLRNYRIAAGSYASLERAIRAASQLRARGLPAQYFSSGNTYVVVVGPYSREGLARSALARIRQSSPDAILYRPDGTKEGVAAKPNNKPSAKPGGGSGTATLTASYLQVGAFKDSKSANALGEKLRSAGFTSFTKNISGLLRVLVGPLSATQIQSIRDILKNQGFDAFPITL
ncbi:MAG: SPOR domain-containing protein [Deinococcales bacterium]